MWPVYVMTQVDLITSANVITLNYKRIYYSCGAKVTLVYPITLQLLQMTVASVGN